MGKGIWATFTEPYSSFHWRGAVVFLVFLGGTVGVPLGAVVLVAMTGAHFGFWTGALAAITAALLGPGYCSLLTSAYLATLSWSKGSRP